MDDENYGAITIDTSIFNRYQLRLKSGLLGQIAQLKDKPVDILMSDIVKYELESHLAKKIKEVNDRLRKSLAHAQEHKIESTLFY